MTEIQRHNDGSTSLGDGDTAMIDIAPERDASSRRGLPCVERGPSYLLMKLRNIDAQVSEQAPLAEVLWSVLQRHFANRLVLDLEGASRLDGATVAQLMTLAQRIRAHHGTIRLCGVSAYNRRVLERFGVMSELPVYADLSGAIFAERRPRLPR
jgi:anti-anti-sigma regulatory factor